MEIRQLEYFMALCEELHFTRAAEKLGISQPSLSQQIRLLEHEAGMPLFDRIGKKTAMTEAGKILLYHASQVFNELAEARAAIGDLATLDRGALRVGALLTAVQYLLPSTVIRFKQRYPNIELSIHGLRTGDICTRLLQNELDLGIVLLPLDHPELETVPLVKEKLVLAVQADHPLARQDAVPLAVLEEAPVILLPGTYSLRQLINEACRQIGFVPQATLEMTTMESIITMVEKKVGATVLPKSYLNCLNKDRIVGIPIQEPELIAEVGIAYRHDKFLCAATRTFMEQLLEAVHNTETQKI